MEDDLLRKFDKFAHLKGYKNRSEAIRDLIRDSLVKEEWEEGDKEIIGIIPIVFDTRKREIENAITSFQHEHYRKVVSVLHIHLSKHYCLEVIVIKGKGREVKSVADRLIGTKGVIHGSLSITGVP